MKKIGFFLKVRLSFGHLNTVVVVTRPDLKNTRFNAYPNMDLLIFTWHKTTKSTISKSAQTTIYEEPLAPCQGHGKQEQRQFIKSLNYLEKQEDGQWSGWRGYGICCRDFLNNMILSWNWKKYRVLYNLKQ